MDNLYNGLILTGLSFRRDYTEAEEGFAINFQRQVIEKIKLKRESIRISY